MEARDVGRAMQDGSGGRRSSFGRGRWCREIWSSGQTGEILEVVPSLPTEDRVFLFPHATGPLLLLRVKYRNGPPCGKKRQKWAPRNSWALRYFVSFLYTLTKIIKGSKLS